MDLQGDLGEGGEDEILHLVPREAVEAASKPRHGQAADAIGDDALAHGQERGLERPQRRLVAVLFLGDEVVDVAPVLVQDADAADVDALAT